MAKKKNKAKAKAKAKKPAAATALKFDDFEIKVLMFSTVDDSEYNPRRISSKADAALAASLKRWGCPQLCVVNRRTAAMGWPAGSRMVMIAGHQRRRLLVKAIHSKAPMVIVDLDHIEEKALNLTLNNPAVAGSFTQDLQAHIDEVRDAMGDEAALELRIEELQNEIKTDSKGTTPADKTTPASTDPTCNVSAGDIFRLGTHYVECTDPAGSAVIDRLSEMNLDTGVTVIIGDPFKCAELLEAWEARTGNTVERVE